MACVLLVEDRGIQRSVVKSFLEQLGHHVVEADTGKSAIDKTTDEVDLVLMDIELPDYGAEAGIQVTQEIRDKGGRFQEIPIVALTVHQEEEMINKMREAGANEYLTKPVNYAELEETIGQFIQA